ncbi:MAG: hypothetical protein AAGJ46_21515 [Planctomycetota bacterium]
MSDDTSGQQIVVPPVITYAPLGELKVYHITEDELDQLEQGSPASLLLNFSLPCLSISISLFASLLLTTIGSPFRFAGFVAVAVATLVAGAVLLALWWKAHSRVAKLADRIRARMPNPGVPERA